MFLNSTELLFLSFEDSSNKYAKKDVQVRHFYIIDKVICWYHSNKAG